MNPLKKTIYFVHDGKAAYPAIPAYERFFSEEFSCASGTLENYQKNFDPATTILWYMMGFYPKKIDALLHIHDYRGLSVGRFTYLKDWIKKSLNFTPDIRIFQNQRMKSALSFSDQIPDFLIPVGISPVLSDEDENDPSQSWDFAYVGAMNRDRNFHNVLDSFLKRFSDRKFALVGPVDDYILTRFSGNANIVFFGKLPQKKAYQILRQARVCVAYFPYHRPHTFQAPTKLLEYMALGVSILANDAPGNIDALKGSPTNAVIAGPDIFKGCPEPETFPPNTPYIDSGLLWPNFIVDSGLPVALNSIISARATPRLLSQIA